MKKLKGRTPLVIGMVGFVAVLALVVGFILPKASQIKTRQGEVTAAQQVEQTLQLQLEQLKGLKQEAPRDRRRLAALQREVPETTKLSEVILQLNDAADDAAVDFMSVSPQSPTPLAAPLVSSVGAQITVQGDYFSVDQFLYQLERLRRVARVTTVSVAPLGDEANPTKLSVNLVAEFYTTDLSAGPGSVPGHTSAAEAGVGVAPAPSPTPSTGA